MKKRRLLCILLQPIFFELGYFHNGTLSDPGVAVGLYMHTMDNLGKHGYRQLQYPNTEVRDVQAVSYSIPMQRYVLYCLPESVLPLCWDTVADCLSSLLGTASECPTSDTVADYLRVSYLCIEIL
jgi:hypothetical protein